MTLKIGELGTFERAELRTFLNKAGLPDNVLTVTAKGYKITRKHFDDAGLTLYHQLTDLGERQKVEMTDTFDGWIEFEPGSTIMEQDVEWLRAGNLLYTLMPTGNWRAPNKNRVSMRIEVDKDAGGDDRAIELAEEIMELLNRKQIDA